MPTGAREAAMDEPDGIAVIGMAGRFPGARDIDEFWANLRSGTESIVDVAEEVLAEEDVPRDLLADPHYVRRAAPVEGVDEFDAEFFGFTPQAARTMDPQQRLLLQLGWHALEDAGYDPFRYDGSVGVFNTASMSSYLLYNLMSRQDTRALLGAGLSLELVQLVGGNDPNFIATRVAHALDLRGPAVGVQTACSSGLVAVHLACQSLLAGECDMAMAGGVSLRIPHRAGYVYDPGAIMSPDGRCRPFDERAAGTVFGSGGGAVLLKPLQDALADGDPVRAVVRGSAINNDGSRKMGFTAPSIDGQAQVVAEALAVAGLEPAGIGYIEAHGTGTALGDPIEVAALAAVFADTDTERSIALGSVKSNIGHLEVAAGIAGLIKTVLALEHRELPPTLHYTRPNPELGLEKTPFHVVDTLVPWTAPGPLRAGVSALGVGGTNAHVVLEEAPPRPAAQPRAGGPAVLLVSARDPGQLEESARRLADRLEAAADDESDDVESDDVELDDVELDDVELDDVELDDVELDDVELDDVELDGVELDGVELDDRHVRADELDDVAVTLAEGRHAHPHRRAVVARTAQQAAEALRTPGHLASCAGQPAGETPGVVLLMPGQGAQYPGMAKGLHQDDSRYRRHFDWAAAGLSDLLGLDVRAAVLGDDATALRRTDVAQAALFSVEYALARLLEEHGVRPAAVAGHSIGEYTAACLAGVFAPEDALRVVAERGRLMHTAPPGTMLTIGLPQDAVAEAVAGAGLEIAAVNEPGSTVVAGPDDAAARLADRLAAQGVTVRRLHTAHAFHTAAMDEAAQRFAERVAAVGLSAPRLPLFSGTTGERMTDAEALDPVRWARQIRHPVRFAGVLHAVLGEPGRVLVECGPGRALTTFARRNPGWGGEHRLLRLMRHPREERDDREAFLLGLGALWAAGLEPDWQAARDGRTARRTRLPGYPFRRDRHWIAPRFTGVPDADLPPAPAGGLPEQTAPLHDASPADTPAERAERLIAAVWTDILGIPEVSAHDNFFDLGGDSVVAVQAASRASRAGLPMTPQDVFQHQTVSALAAAVSTGPATEAPVTADATEVPPFTATQWWVVERAGDRLGEFTVPLLLDIADDVTTAAVCEAVGAVAAHHEALRLRLETRDGLWEQRVLPPGDIDVPAIPLPAGPPDSMFQEADAVLADLGRNLLTDSGPLFRAAVLDAGPGAPRRLALVMHHFCVDNASERILLEDLSTACGQLREGQPVLLPPVVTPWSSWAQWAAGLTTDRDVLDERGDWLRTLGADGAFGLPALSPPHTDPARRVALAPVELDQDTTEALTRLQRERRARLDEFVLAAVAVAVAEATGEDRVLMDVEGHGRAVLPPGMDLSRTVGTCTTLHPVCVEAGRKGVRGAAESARRALRSVPREGLGYGVLRTLHAPSAALFARLPAPDLLVTYLGAVTYEAVAELGEGEGPLRPSAVAGLSARSVPACLTHGTELRAYLHDGRLHLDWWYDADRYDSGPVIAAGARAVSALRDLTRQAPSGERTAQGGTPWADVSEDELRMLFGDQNRDM
ncbi:beta-ketoacyl synthase N-terminal-like domain-containing protein [Streptomyces sp. YIM S03343]